MGDYICPVCRGHGVTAQEKFSLRLYGDPTTCHRCGASLTVSTTEEVLGYLLLVVAVILCVLFRHPFIQALTLFTGAALALYWHMQCVPLVESARHIRLRNRDE